MQRTITLLNVDFEVEFDRAGDVDAIYIGAVEVSDVISPAVSEFIHATVHANADRWFDEYLGEIAAEEQAIRRAA